jgi:uncharacterized alkaline shock family protein YloU
MEKKLGVVRIAPNVLATIARLTALAVPGVVRVGNAPGLLGRRLTGDGAQIDVSEGVVAVQMYLVAEQGKNLLALSREVQSEVTRAISDTVGMPVREVNVHIVDVEEARQE